MSTNTGFSVSQASDLTSIYRAYTANPGAANGIHEKPLSNFGSITFIDSTPLCVCKNSRTPRHRTFIDEAGRGKSSTGWFYGFKLHLIVKDHDEILPFLEPGNVDDRKPVPKLVKSLIGKLSGDRGYISKKLAKLLASQDISLITTLKKNMKNSGYRRI